MKQLSGLDVVALVYLGLCGLMLAGDACHCVGREMHLRDHPEKAVCE